MSQRITIEEINRGLKEGCKLVISLWGWLLGMFLVGLYLNQYGIFDPPITGLGLKVVFGLCILYSVYLTCLGGKAMYAMIRVRRRLKQGDV